MTTSALDGIRRRQADIARRIRAVEAISAYSKASLELRSMVVDECERLVADNKRVIADLELVEQEWSIEVPA